MGHHQYDINIIFFFVNYAIVIFFREGEVLYSMFMQPLLRDHVTGACGVGVLECASACWRSKLPECFSTLKYETHMLI